METEVSELLERIPVDIKDMEMFLMRKFHGSKTIRAAWAVRPISHAEQTKTRDGCRGSWRLFEVFVLCLLVLILWIGVFSDCVLSYVIHICMLG